MARRFRSPVWLALGIAALASAQGFREQVRVGLITVRLEVRGTDGRPLQDLKASEVKLKVDGKDVPVEGLDRVEAAAPAAAPKPAASAPRPDTGVPRNCRSFDGRSASKPRSLPGDPRGRNVERHLRPARRSPADRKLL